MKPHLDRPERFWKLLIHFLEEAEEDRASHVGRDKHTGVAREFRESLSEQIASESDTVSGGK